MFCLCLSFKKEFMKERILSINSYFFEYMFCECFRMQKNVNPFCIHKTCWMFALLLQVICIFTYTWLWYDIYLQFFPFPTKKLRKYKPSLRICLRDFFSLQTRRQNQFPAYIDRNDWDYFPLLMACKHKPWRNKLMWKWRYDCFEAVLSCP